MQGKSKRIFIIGLDGAIGWAIQKAITPNIDKVLAEGVVTYSATTVFPSASFEAWGAMFHGVGPEKHKLNGNHPCPEDFDFPSFMKVAKGAYPDVKCASFCCWEPINTNIIEQSINCQMVSMPDPQIVVAAGEYIRKNTPDIFFMHLDYIDGAGHSHGYRTQKYMDQINATDKLVGIVINAIHDSGVFDESLIVLLSDHGSVGTSHGSNEPDCMNIFWGCSGPGVKKGIELKEPLNIMDTSAVVLYALGLPAPSSWDAKIPKNLFCF